MLYSTRSEEDERKLDDVEKSPGRANFVKRMKTFKYLVSTMAKDGELDAESIRRVHIGWKKRERVLELLCDRKKINGKVCRTVIRPALAHGAETWALKKAHEQKLDAAQMRMLRWMCGVTKLARIRNEKIKGQQKWKKSQRKSRKGD